MPRPPAAFSPLTTTKSSAELLAQRRAAARAPRAGPPATTTSPMKRMVAARPCDEATRMTRGHAAPARPPCPAGCSSCSCRSRSSGCCWSCGPPGRVLLLFMIGALIALLLNPFVTLLRRARFPRGLAVLAVMIALLACVIAGIGLLLANPIADQVVDVPAQRPEHRRRRQPQRSPTSRAGSTATASTSRSPKEGQTALQTLGDQRVRGLGRARLLHARRAHHARRGLAGADPRDRDQRLHAALRRADRRGGPRAAPAGRRHARRTTTRRASRRAVLGYVRGQLLFSLIMGDERRRDAVGARLARRSSPTARRTRCSSAPCTGSPS